MQQQQPLWMMMADEAESDEAVSDDEGIEGFNVSSLSLSTTLARCLLFFRFFFGRSPLCVRARFLSNPLLQFLCVLSVSLCRRGEE